VDEDEMMKARATAGPLRGGRAITGAVVLALAVLLGGTGCSAAHSAATFTPGVGGSASAGPGQPSDGGAAPAGYVMPPFGKDVDVEMTSWMPSDPAQAKAVTVDKNYELAYLYAEYRGGQDQGWENYVSPAMESAVQGSLQGSDVTTESFTGTIKYFDMSVITDPLVKGDLDVSACFDNAGSSNTNLTTGKVIPDTGSPDSHYVRIGDELRQGSGGQWQVVSSLPAIYYPKAAQCKP
jgi:hypothetical protein